MSKSGLADSPFFKMQPLPVPAPQQVTRDAEVVQRDRPPVPLPKQNARPRKVNLRTTEVPKSASPEVRELGSSEVPKLRSYELRKFDELRRLDVRITGEQKRYLDDLEEDIRQTKPEGDMTNPNYQRITKNSIIRALLEIARQLGVKLNASRFQNENDLLQALFEELTARASKFRTSEVRK